VGASDFYFVFLCLSYCAYEDQLVCFDASQFDLIMIQRILSFIVLLASPPLWFEF